MGSRQAGNGERVPYGQACLEGIHEECGHWRGSGSARNPRRLRRERFTILCGCDVPVPAAPTSPGHRAVYDMPPRLSNPAANLLITHDISPHQIHNLAE